MPIVLYNPTSRGKFMKYVSVGGIVKSVWVDAFKEYLVPEVNSIESIVNKLDKSRLEKAEELQNSKTIDAYLYREKLAYLRKVTDEARWASKITDRFTSKVGILMIKDGIKHAFSVDSLAGLSEIGTVIYSGGINPTQLNERYDGTYTYDGVTLEITSGQISSIDGFSGSDMYTLRNILGTANQVVYVEQDTNILAINTQYYSDANLQNTFNSSLTYRYDVPSSNINRKITLSSGRVSSTQTYTMQAANTFYLSGSSGTSYSLYVETGIDVYDPADNPILFSDNQGIINSALNTTLFTLTPSFKYLIVSSGRVIYSPDINQGGGGGGADSYVFTQGRVNTTIYVSAGTPLIVGTFVYTNSGLSVPLVDGTYSYGGNSYVISGGLGRISKVN